MARIVDVGIRDSDLPFIWRQCALLVLLAAVGLTSSLTAQYFAAKAALGFGTALRRDLFAHINTLSYTELDRIGAPTLVTRMTSDVNQVQNGLNMTLRLLLRSPFIVIGAIIMAFTISPALTGWFLLITAAIALVIWLIMRGHRAGVSSVPDHAGPGHTADPGKLCGRPCGAGLQPPEG